MDRRENKTMPPDFYLILQKAMGNNGVRLPIKEDTTASSSARRCSTPITRILAEPQLIAHFLLDRANLRGR